MDIPNTINPSSLIIKRYVSFNNIVNLFICYVNKDFVIKMIAILNIKNTKIIQFLIILVLIFSDIHFKTNPLRNGIIHTFHLFL